MPVAVGRGARGGAAPLGASRKWDAASVSGFRQNGPTDRARSGTVCSVNERGVRAMSDVKLGRLSAGVMAMALGTVAMLGGPQGAAAAAPWLPPVDLAAPQPTNGVGSPAIASALDGTTVAVFTQREGSTNRVYVSVRSPGGVVAAPFPLSDPGVAASNPDVAVDAQGNATAVWSLASSVVQASTRPPGGAWSAPQSVSGPGAQVPLVDASSNGAAVIGFVAGTGAGERVQAAVRLPNAPNFPNFATPVIASQAAGSLGIYNKPSVGIDGAGNVTAFWQRLIDLGGGDTRYVNESGSKGSTSPSFAPSEARSSTTVGSAGARWDLAVTNAGRVFAIWDYNPGGASRIDYAERLPGATSWQGSPGAPNTLLATPTVSASSPAVAMNEANAVAVAWSTPAGLVSSVRPAPGLTFGAAKLHATTAFNPTLAMAADGKALLAWSGPSASDYTVFAALRPSGGEAFGTATEVTRGRTSAALATFSGLDSTFDDQGNAFVVAERAFYGTPTEYTPVALGLDDVAPVLSGLDVPGTATVGTSVGLSVGATDRMSTPEFAWDFGDGTAGSGASVTHTYGAAGVYTVTVKATDGGGNVTTSSRQIQISVPATPPATPPVSGPAPSQSTPVPPAGGGGNGGGGTRPLAVVTGSPKLGTTALSKGRTRITALTVGSLLAGDAVTVTCAPRSKGCRKPATTTTTAKGAGSLSLTKKIKGTTLSAGATLAIRITRPGATARIVTFTMQRGKAPSKKTRCQEPGAKTTKAC